jgi:hypothetical protein
MNKTQLVKTVKEFCDYNSNNWTYHHDYKIVNGEEFVSITSKNLLKSVTLHKNIIHDIIIESNQLCIALKSKIMVWLGGDTNTLVIDSTDTNNPMFKDLK